jgi:two-component system, sensor histidine kinase RpfC
MGPSAKNDGLYGLASMAIVYFAYNFICAIVAHKRMGKPEVLMTATAILDPLMLSAWLILTGEAAVLFVAFYMFTILGFGFRIGTKPMWICQVASTVGFIAVIAFSKHWHLFSFNSASVLILLVAVPLYATILIKKLIDARSKAEHESLAKSRLLASVSHELRTPLNGIVAAAQILNIEGNPRAVGISDTILKLSNDLLEEINDLLDSAKYRSRSIKPEMESCDLNELIDRLRITLETPATDKGLSFSLYSDPGIEDAVLTDKVNLTRVIMNIAGNAVKFTTCGSVDVRISLLEATARTYRIQFHIQDTGIGIPREEIPYVFEPFYRASTGRMNHYPGTGLGMCIAYDLVKMLGGELALESEVGKGSEFSFELTMTRVPKVSMTESVEKDFAVVRGKRILVAEDNTVNRMLIHELLLVDAHRVTLAQSGEHAQARLQDDHFDLVLLDYNLGDMYGNEVLQAYFASVSHPAPVYFLTADATEATRNSLIEQGASGVMHKPIMMDELRKTIARHCTVQEAGNDVLASRAGRRAF